MLLILFLQLVSCDNYDKWLNAMKEELKFMEHNDVRNVVNCQKVVRDLVVSGYVKINVTLIHGKGLSLGPTTRAVARRIQ